MRVLSLKSVHRESVCSPVVYVLVGVCWQLCFFVRSQVLWWVHPSEWWAPWLSAPVGCVVDGLCLVRETCVVVRWDVLALVGDAVCGLEVGRYFTTSWG